MIKAFETNLLSSIDKEMIRLMDEYNYIGISISCLDPDVKSSIYWSTKAANFICGEPLDNNEKNSRCEKGFPGVWEVIRALDKIHKEKTGKYLSGGCGNTHQYQLNYNHPLSKVSYKKIDGIWYVKNIENVTNELSNKYGI
jgi:hypothetical protein